MSDALEAALYQIANLGAAYEAKLAREAADPTIQKLDAFVAANKLPDPRHGYFGGMDVFAQLASSRHWRVKRAQALRVARCQQLAGVVATTWLSKAAWCRQSEVAYRKAEQPTLNTVADLICAAVASSTSLDAVGERETMQAAE